MTNDQQSFGLWRIQELLNGYICWFDINIWLVATAGRGRGNAGCVFIVTSWPALPTADNIAKRQRYDCSLDRDQCDKESRLGSEEGQGGQPLMWNW